MSINLQCKEVELWQTPTWVTNICYSKNQGGWRGIRDRYLIWLNSQLNGVYSYPRELQQKREIIQEHQEELLSFKQLHFYFC